ncbi:ABC transporter permease [Flavilitoribacter nigricans]|nr:ABC transporter permease [Flavilitoribacter nigricans]
MIKLLHHSLRTLFKYRLYTLVSWIGLGVSLASIWFIADYIQQSRQYDAFHEKNQNIYRLTMDVTAGGQTDQYATTGLPPGDLLQQNFPDVTAYARLGFHAADVRVGQKVFRESGFYQANPQTLEVFSFDLLAGKREQATTQPNIILLTRSLAEKYFNSIDIIGEQIMVGEENFTVSGVFQDWPPNAHLQINALIMATAQTAYDPQEWFNLENYTYVLLAPTANAEKLNEHLQAFTDRELTPLLEDSGLAVRFHAQPLREIYFSPGLVDDVPKGNRMYLVALAIAGLLVLGIAGLNFINLTLTRSVQRTKEIRLKKILGISRRRLLLQSSTESGVMTVLILLLSTLLIFGFARTYSAYTGFDALALDGKWLLIGLLPLLVLVLGLLGTSYSGIYLSFSSRTVHEAGTAQTWLKNTLLGLEYVLTGVILIVTLAIGQQLDFIRQKDLGFSQDQIQIVALPDTEHTPGKVHELKARIQQLAGVKNASLVSGGALPGEENGKEVFQVIIDGKKTEKVYNIYRIDEDYFDLLEIPLARGRNFDPEQLNDRSGSVIINQALVRALGWEEPIGRRIWYGEDTPLEVVGVIENFHNKSLHHLIEPIVFLYNTNYAGKLLVKAPPGAGGMIRSEWETLFPEIAFSLTYFDQFLAAMYSREDQLAQLFRFFALIALLLCCTGLFALFSLHVHQRTREMSIRKVLGAGPVHLLRSVTRRYSRITLISVAVAMPIAWWLIKRWLQAFSYRIEPGPDLFLVSGALMLLVSTLVITYHLIRVLRVNPVDALKTE